MIFGRKRQEGKSVLVLDVENGSVGACLVHVSPHTQPKLFGEVRKKVPLQHTHNPEILARLIETTVQEALAHVSHVAARMRAHPALASAGVIDEVALFLSPPWGVMPMRPEMQDPHPFVERVQRTVESFTGSVPITSEPFGHVAVFTTPLIVPAYTHQVLVLMSGDVTELVLLEHKGDHLSIEGHATMPLGRHYPIRTLRTHGGLSEAEAYSALTLHARDAGPRHALEALHAAGLHMAGEFGSVAQELFAHVPAQSVLVIAEEPVGDWFARTLAESPTSASLFPEKGEVRALRSRHVTPFMSTHSAHPDLPLLLEALFVNTRFTSEL